MAFSCEVYVRTATLFVHFTAYRCEFQVITKKCQPQQRPNLQYYVQSGQYTYLDLSFIIIDFYAVILLHGIESHLIWDS